MLLSLHRFGVLKLKVVAFTMARSKLNSRINLKNSCYSHLLKEKTCCFLIINLSKKILFSTLEWLFHVVFLSKNGSRDTISPNPFIFKKKVMLPLSCRSAKALQRYF
jgi:hypothetical protein